ncbi:expressed unknown protein [Seminavis robusta]|uniref:Uncharacterized protein n=1 Tax=Seminavis robusta TaxID=568900 RepID=A0A9N8EF10_9STRA|nr:expressed unknown protein [Seminavis robusta]|eukprot:Sro1086_g239720.1 n/a (940) ;mRNA; f:14703-17522
MTGFLSSSTGARSPTARTGILFAFFLLAAVFLTGTIGQWCLNKRYKDSEHVAAKATVRSTLPSATGTFTLLDTSTGSGSSATLGATSLRQHTDHTPNDDKKVGWEFAGPTTYRFQDEGLASAAAVQTVVESKDYWFIGSVNGGIWRTPKPMSQHPHWENVLDGQPVTCSSISAMHVALNYTSGTGHPGMIVYAGCGGSTSSEQGYDWNVVNSGDWGGIMVSKDQGTTWSMVDGFPVNYYVTDIYVVRENDGKPVLLVAAQSHLWDRNKGGIWRSDNYDGTSFQQVSKRPTFSLLPFDPSGNWILATHTHSTNTTVSISRTSRRSFRELPPLPWQTPGTVPFYTCATVISTPGGGRYKIIVGALTRLPGGLSNHTDSQIFVSGIFDPGDYPPRPVPWSTLPQPMRLDQDSMPKDRMALLLDPHDSDFIYVAGNAEALVWRVDITTQVWAPLWDDHTGIPHADCRNFAYDSDLDRLLLVSDGGIFGREAVGYWVSLNGDYSGLEVLTAQYDPQQDRYVAGAQDNCVLVVRGDNSHDEAVGFIEGDGTVTAVDSRANPSRLFGAVQFLGLDTLDNDPDSSVLKDDDDDDDCGGICFLQGDKSIHIPVDKYFPEPSSFPYFVHHFTLNYQDPTLFQFWVNRTGGDDERPSGIYQLHIPYTVQDPDDIGPPTMVMKTPPGSMIMNFVSGGYTAGTPDPNLLVGISNTHVHVRSLIDHSDDGGLVIRPLPVTFAIPLTLDYDKNTGARILGPVTHARTVFLSVLSERDSRVMAVTGWQSIQDNLGEEAVFFTTDAGKSWKNVTGNLREASGVVGKVRPGGILLVDLDRHYALMVGSSNGIMVTFVKASLRDMDDPDTTTSNDVVDPSPPPTWVRLGTYEEFPIVLTANVEYEPTTDRLVAATYGRGIYVLKDAKAKLLDAQRQMDEGRLASSTYGNGPGLSPALK